MVRVSVLVVVVALSGCQGPGPEPAPTQDVEPMTQMTLTSSAFEEGQPIPERYTCDDADHSPPLTIQGVPDAAASLVLLVDDPDAGDTPWVHWLVYDIPPRTALIPESPSMERLQAREGQNSWGKAGWGGPCPPSGTHTYQFRLFAVDYMTGLDAGATRADVEQAIAGHIVAESTLTGTYRRTG